MARMDSRAVVSPFCLDVFDEVDDCGTVACATVLDMEYGFVQQPTIAELSTCLFDVQST